MNFEPTFPTAGGREAKIRFGDADYQVLQPGEYIRCAVTGRPIRLEELRYWSVERQEAYASADVAFKRYRDSLG
ncbi:MAG: DUF2093 domain-containing protein [Hyphomicrobiales bacterium]